MVKSYLGYELASTFGVVVSASSNVVYYVAGDSHIAVVPALEQIIAWDIRRSEKLYSLIDPNCGSEVTALCKGTRHLSSIISGHADGSIRIWDTVTKEVKATLNGHKAAINCLSIDGSESKLVSGSKDTFVVLWDLVSESGICKLVGHQDQVTTVKFINASSRYSVSSDAGATRETTGYIISAGKDSLLKLWDLSLQHCVETRVACTGGCWCMDVNEESHEVVTAGHQEGEVKVWSLNVDEENKLIESATLQRTQQDRPVSLEFNPDSDLLLCHGVGKTLDVWRRRSHDEVKKVKRKRQKEQTKQDSAATTSEHRTAAFVHHTSIRQSAGIRAASWGVRSRAGTLSHYILSASSNNFLELYELRYPAPDLSTENILQIKSTLDSPGHRSDIRTMALSSDERILVTGSHGMLKVWNTMTQRCIRNVECDATISSVFLPGDRHVLIGTKEGTLQLIDIGAAVTLQTLTAHNGPVWSLSLHPNGRTIASGGADKCVKFWTLSLVDELVLGTDRTARNLTITVDKVLQLPDEVLCVRFSPNGKLLAMSLMDLTVKVFQADSLKFLLSLYGHRLPVLTMDISYDSNLLVTGSADKNVKIWGLDFGDCHKSIFAHDDSVMQVLFEHDSHNFVTASKDHKIKLWDGENFQRVATLVGHLGEIWALVRASSFIISASHDKSIRVWRQTGSDLFIEEQREKELENFYDEDMVENGISKEIADGGTESRAVTQASLETMKAGERIVEALEISFDDVLARDLPEAGLSKTTRHVVFRAMNNISAEIYMMKTCEKIPLALLFDALLVLNFNDVTKFLVVIERWVLADINILLCSRILLFIVKTHFKQLIATQRSRNIMESIGSNMHQCLKRRKEQINFNSVALGILLEGSNVHEGSG